MLPPRSPAAMYVGTCAAALIYAAVSAVSADADAVLPIFCMPKMLAVSNPVTAVPGESPRSPTTTLVPALVTVVPANSAYEAEMPSEIGCASKVAIADDFADELCAATALHCEALYGQELMMQLA